MIELVLQRWSAWAPGLATREAWAAWSASPRVLGSGEVADAAFLPAMLRRRCTPLSRAMLAAAFGCVQGESAATVRTVFASRHGSINESVPLFHNIAHGERMSPSRFTHTVHNAQSGLFSIAAGNRMASSAMSARAETFACGFLEAATHLHREPERGVLLVVGDVALSDTFAPLIEEPDAAYAVGLLLASAGDGTPLRFEVRGEDDAPAPGVPVAEADAVARGWPDAAEFVRWLHGDAAELRLRGNGRTWTWRR